MKEGKVLKNSPICEICHKGPVSGYNRPHSLHRTKRVVKPNIQKINGIHMCTSCLRTLNRQKKSA